MQLCSPESAAGKVRRAGNPIARGREILLDEYWKTRGVYETDVPLAASFEIIRSMVVQAVYETIGPAPGWLSVAELEPEMEKAHMACRETLCNGLESGIRRFSPGLMESRENLIRASLEAEAMGPGRFLGSIRMHVPGAGYAISARKRHDENQDSFALARHSGRKFLVLADGCGSARFAAIASHLAVREMLSHCVNGISSASICGLSEQMAFLLNDEIVKKAAGEATDAGISTLIAGLVEKGKSRVFKVGDSIPFMAWKDPEVDIIETLSIRPGMNGILGQAGRLAIGDIEEFERPSGRLILTSDGVTNYLEDATSEIARWIALSSDPIIISERILRSVLRNQVAWNHCDDATIIVEDTSG
jgi:serine/threonine protein phosphatase PrpC